MDDVRRIHDEWARAWFAKDAAAVDTIMAPDFLYIGLGGHAVDRATILAVIRDPSYRLTRASRSEIVVRKVGADAVVVRDRWQGAGQFRGQTFVDDHTCSFIYERTASGWQLVLENAAARVESGAGPT